MVDVRVLSSLKELIEREEQELVKLRYSPSDLNDVLLADAIEEEIKELKRLYWELLDMDS